MATVFVVDDDAGMRASLADVLIGAGYRVAAFGSAEEFLLCADAAQHVVSCLLVDMCLPLISGVELQQYLASRGLAVPTVFMTGYADVRTTIAAMKGGAVDFLLKPFSAPVLLDAVRVALSSSARSMADAQTSDDLQRRLIRLTPREREVLDLVARGFLNKQIAVQLGVTLGTVKAHRGRLTRKLAVDSVADLVRVADRVATATEHVDLGRMAPAPAAL